MVEITVPLLLDIIRTAGILVGIVYYLMIMRNNQKALMIDMVSRRAQEANNYEYQMMVRRINPLHSGWDTPEEFYEKYNIKETPELALSRVIVQNTLNHWGFLFREGVIGLEFIERLYNPWHIIRFWESFKPLMLDSRETMGNPQLFSDMEYLYNALKKKYPNLSRDTKFKFQSWMKDNSAFT
jgi:hypothetical protein